MKVKKSKSLKITVSKIAGKQTKARLPAYKAKSKLIQQGCKLKCLDMKPARKNTMGVQSTCSSVDSVHQQYLVSQCNLKRRKKKYTTIKKSGNERQNSVGTSLESSKDSAGACLTGSKSDKQCCDSQEKRPGLGSPVIIEALSENLSSLKIPKAFRQNINVHEHSSKHDVSYAESVCLEKDDVSVIVAQSMNPNDHYDKDDSVKKKSPLKSNRKQRKDRKKLREMNLRSPTSAETLNESNVVEEEYGDNTENDTVNEGDSFVETETGNSVDEKNKTDTYEDQDPVRFYSVRNKVVAVMSERARFSFTGKLIARVIYGAVEAYGCVITVENSPIEIYSPRGYSGVAIEASDKSSGDRNANVWPLLRNEGINDETENKLTVEVGQVHPGMAILVLSNLENRLSRFLNVYYPFRLFPTVKNLSYYSWTDQKRAEVILQSNIYMSTPGSKELIIDPCVAQQVSEKMLNDWRENKWSCSLIAGGKSVGKSTATRYLINSLLPVSKMVVLVDVDPGQTECTPPACISYSLIEQPLMGPNFTHLKTPVFQLYIGDVNVSRCITRYIEGIKMLIDKLSNCPILSRLPIVVNTMGFTHGIGWDIIIFTIKLIRPSLVVQIMSEKPKNNYIGPLSKQVINRRELPWASWGSNVIDWSKPCDHELFVVRSHAERKTAPGSDAWNMEPYQQRELMLHSYFSEIVESSANATPHCDAASFNINEAVPYATPFSALNVSIPRTSVPPWHILNVMNGNIVALCGINEENNVSQEERTRFGSGVRVLHGSPLCPCYGFGIIRGVDKEREEVFINTPLPPSMMLHVNYLVGCTPVPVTLLQLHQQKNVPYTGGNDVLPTSREPRRGYFRMRYQKVQTSS